MSEAEAAEKVTWRVIQTQVFTAAMNMAIDEAICDEIAAGHSMPTIRFYRWAPSAVSIGYFQGLSYEVDQDACQKASADVVRRRTGGGAVYHDTNGEITYSVLAPMSLFPKGITASYELVCGWIVSALKSLGMQASFSPINDVLVDGKKISGSAQTRKNGIFHMHGTILYKVDVEKMFSLLQVGKVKVSDKMIASVKKRVTSVADATNDSSITIDHLQKALIESFTEGKKYELGDYSEEELRQASQLEADKYGNSDWLHMR